MTSTSAATRWGGLDESRTGSDCAALRAALDERVLAALRPTCIGLALLFLASALSRLGRTPANSYPTLLELALLTAVALVLVFAMLRWASPPSSWAQPLAAGVLLLVVANATARLWLTPAPHQIAGFLLIAVAAPCVLLSPRWLAVVLACTVGGWAAVAFQLPLAGRAVNAAALLGAAALACVIQSLRLGDVRRAESLRLQVREAAEQNDSVRALLAEREERFRQLAELDAGGVALDEAGVLRTVSRRFATLVGSTPEALVGRELDSLLLPDADAGPEALALTEAEQRFTALALRADRTTVPVEVQRRQWHHAGGLSGVVVVRDLREKRRVQRATLALQASADGLWDWDLDAGELYLSPHWKVYFGWSDDEGPVAAESWFARLDEADRSAFADALAACEAGIRDTFDLRYRMRGLDGKPRRVQTRAVVVRNGSGRPVRVVGSQITVDRGSFPTAVRREGAVRAALG